MTAKKAIRLKEHTWEQERAAVVAWLVKQESHAEAQEKTTHDEEARLYLESRLSTLAEIKCVLEDGEHWTESREVKPVPRRAGGVPAGEGCRVAGAYGGDLFRVHNG